MKVGSRRDRSRNGPEVRGGAVQGTAGQANGMDVHSTSEEARGGPYIEREDKGEARPFKELEGKRTTGPSANGGGGPLRGPSRNGRRNSRRGHAQTRGEVRGADRSLKYRGSARQGQTRYGGRGGGRAVHGAERRLRGGRLRIDGCHARRRSREKEGARRQGGGRTRSCGRGRQRDSGAEGDAEDRGRRLRVVETVGGKILQRERGSISPKVVWGLEGGLLAPHIDVEWLIIFSGNTTTSTNLHRKGRL